MYFNPDALKESYGTNGPVAVGPFEEAYDPDKLICSFIFFIYNILTNDTDISHGVFHVLRYIIISQKEYLQGKITRFRFQLVSAVGNADAALF